MTARLITKSAPHTASPGREVEDWRAHAVCRDADDPDLWFPNGRVGALVRMQVQEAKRHCAGCAVQPECLDWSLEERPEYGVFGGLDEDERKRLLRRVRRREYGRHGRVEAAWEQILRERRTEFVELAGQGASIGQLMRAMRTSAQTVHAVLNKLAEQGVVLQQQRGVAA